MKTMGRKWILLSLVLALLLFSIVWMRWRPAKRFDFSLPGDHDFRVATWNVGYFSVVENKNVRAMDLKPIAETIQEIHADVVILQELGSLEHPKVILQVLGNDWRAYSVETGHGTQVLSIFTRSKVRETSEFECGGRKVKALSLVSGSGMSIYMIGVHAPHPARGMSDNIENIRCALSHAMDRDEEIRIIAGDMNYNFDPQDKEGLLYREILESFGDATKSLGETYYAHTRIDHIFHYPKNLPLVEHGSGVLDLPLRFAKVPGFRDHRPIVVTYDLSGRRS